MQCTGRFSSAKGSAMPVLSRNLLTSFGLFLVLAAPAAAESVPADRALRPVLVAPIHYSTETDRRTFVAVIRPRVEADLGFRVAGKVARRLVDVGRVVKSGEPLAELDTTDLRLQKEQAEAELAASLRALEQARLDEQRVAALNEQRVASNAQHDRARTALEESRSRNLRAQRAAELARNALDYAVLRADSDGVVSLATIEPGQVVAAGQPAMRIARAGEREAAVAIPEAYVARVKQGVASLSLWSAPDRQFKATLRELSPAADPVARTFAARFTIEGADDSIALGMSATLSIAAVDQARLARVPLSALFNQGKGAALWTVTSEGALTLKRVAVARYDGRDALIAGGVDEGERIVVLGVQKLDPAVKVRPVTEIAY